MLASGGYGSNPEIAQEVQPEVLQPAPDHSAPCHGRVHPDGRSRRGTARQHAVRRALSRRHGRPQAAPGAPTGAGSSRASSACSKVICGWTRAGAVSSTRTPRAPTPASERCGRSTTSATSSSTRRCFRPGARSSSPASRSKMQSGASIFKADTIPALAAASGHRRRRSGRDARGLQPERQAGQGPGAQRTDIVPIETGPYYAIKTTGVLFTTMGGVRTNVNLQALDAAGKVIPGLYVVGEVMGMAQVMGDGLCGGCGNGVAITFGRLAARHAVAQARVCTGWPRRPDLLPAVASCPSATLSSFKGVVGSMTTSVPARLVVLAAGLVVASAPAPVWPGTNEDPSGLTIDGPPPPRDRRSSLAIPKVGRRSGHTHRGAAASGWRSRRAGLRERAPRGRLRPAAPE